MTQDHFSMEASGTPTAPGVFVDLKSVPSVEFVEGVKFQPTLGQNVLANYVTYQPHCEAPRHVHVEEQVVIVVGGELDFTIDGETRRMGAGDMAVIPPWVPHAARAGERGCTQIDVFSPPRSTLIELAGRDAGEHA
jgi:quercetin dioxygenase-like cupin family protein